MVGQPLRHTQHLFKSSIYICPQVWAVGVPDQRVYYRSGVTLSELTGRSWRPVKAPVQLSRHSTQVSIVKTCPLFGKL